MKNPQCSLHALKWNNQLGLHKIQSDRFCDYHHSQSEDEVDSNTHTEYLVESLMIVLLHLNGQKTLNRGVHCTIQETKRHNKSCDYVINTKVTRAKCVKHHS